ncbi:MAG: bifunctional aspartate kinase/homoserine dehydrogenase I, partial [Pyrinomonadaceae bacterium]
MKVLKFGGSSVGNAESIEKVAEIIRTASAEGPCAVVLSAMQGTTDDLIAAGRTAERGDDGFIETLSNIADRHLKTIRAIFHNGQTLRVTEFVENTIKELENLFEGVRLIRELSPKTLDRILSFGEIVSSRMVSAVLIESGLNNEWVDSRLVIRSDSNHGFAGVDFAETNDRIKQHFQ